jgi:hypothetical protein
MRTWMRSMAILMVAVLVIPIIGMAEETKDAPVKKEVVKLRYKNIQDEMNPDFDYLADIGEMIDNGRYQKDGHDLLAAAMLLSMAEKATGKVSTFITAKALLAEIGELAKGQKNAELAKALSDFYGGSFFTMDKAKAGEFAKLAKEFEATASATRGYGWVKVENFTSYFVDVYIDDWYEGRVYSGYYSYFKIWEGETELYAEAPYTEPYNWYWGPRSIDLYEDETYTWTITD